MGDNISRHWFRGHCIICSERGKEKNKNKKRKEKKRKGKLKDEQECGGYDRLQDLA